MALSATPYKIEFSISDIERNCYAQTKQTVAQHPSETPVRLLARIMAFALFYHEQLQFGRGLSDADEAALWEIDYTNTIIHWIDVGQPDSERVLKASRRAQQYSVLIYGNTRVWKDKVMPLLAGMKQVRVIELPEAEMQYIASRLERNMQLNFTISDGIMYLSWGNDNYTLPIQWLLNTGEEN